MKRLLSLSVFLMMALLSFAHDFEVKNADEKTIYYNITSSTAPYTVAVTYQGTSYSEYSNEYSGDVTIPESVSYGGKTYSVTSIDYGAFFECSGLTSVTIPNSVTSIDYLAFYDCTGLTSVTIPNSVTSIGKSAFYGCSGLKSVTIGNSVTSISNDAFEVCGGLTSIVVEKGNTKYDSRNNCNAIIETASNTLISGCKTTVIPNSVTAIGSYAFAFCNGLTSITIPNSVTSIGSYAFSGCSGLTSVTIGNSVTTISNNAFLSCNGLTSIVVEKGNTKYDSRNNCNAIIETASNTLILGCKTTVIPNSVTSIGDNAFEGCSRLTSVTIPNSVTTISNYTFYYCTGLTSITIPNSVTSIGISAFAYCSGLTSVTIPNSVTSIGDYAFSGCSGLKEITSYIQKPFKTGDYCWDLVNKSIPLYVPVGTKEKYQGTDGWKEFTNIQEVDMTGIEAVTAEGVSNADIIDIYDLNGRRRDTLQPGVNIVKMSDGTTRKVIKR